MNIKQTSELQYKKKREIARIKSSLPLFCLICGRSDRILDAAHLLPRSTFPEHDTEEWNIALLCRDPYDGSGCHNDYDNKLAFRQQQIKIYDIVKEHDEKGAYRYFEI